MGGPASSKILVRKVYFWPLAIVAGFFLIFLHYLSSLPRNNHQGARIDTSSGSLPSLHKNEGNSSNSGAFEELLEARDKLVIDYLLKWHLFPPSPLPYNLSSSDPVKLKADALGGIVTSNLGSHLNAEVKGFFLEAGAMDGEYISNTLQLEAKGWEGLLVEASPTQFAHLKSKNRKAWLANVCLSASMKKVTFAKYIRTDEPWFAAMGKPVVEGQGIDPELTPEAQAAECFPLAYLLRALNRTRIDFFSLDVEGFELEVLQDFPFDQIDVRVLVVENAHSPGGKKAIAELMKPRGFDLFLEQYPDSYFVKKNSG